MKKLMYLSISILCLSIAALIGFHIGSHSVQAQPPQDIHGYSAVYYPGGELHFAMLSNGDVYRRLPPDQFPWTDYPPQYIGNYWENIPVPTDPATFGSVKGDWKK